MTESSAANPQTNKHDSSSVSQNSKAVSSSSQLASGKQAPSAAGPGPGDNANGNVNTPDGRELPLQSLEEASSAGDVPKTCSLLQMLRQQFSEQSRKNWPADTVRKLWTSALNALSNNPSPEVKGRACQLMEVLGQSCKSCIEGDWEPILEDDAPERVIEVLNQYPQDLTLLSSATRAVLSFSGCLTCRSFYDGSNQDMLGGKGAVEALLGAIVRLQETVGQNVPETQACKLARRAIADAVQALHYLCLMNRANVARLASGQGLRVVRMCIEDDGNELTVQEHGCMLLAELACRHDASDQEVIECVATVTNVARLQMQEKFIEVARAAVWSLTRIASSALHPYNHPYSHQSQDDSWMAGLWQVWPIMQGQALRMIVDMMQSCQLKDDPLVKHCLDFIAVVGGDDGSKNGGDQNRHGLSALSVAATIVYQVFLSTQHTRMQAVALRTLYALLSNPQCWPVEIGLSEVIDGIFKAMRNARRWRETASKDVFCVQAFGMGVIFKLLEPPQETDPQRQPLEMNRLTPYVQDIHAAVEYIARYIDEGNEKFNFEFKSLNLKEPVVEVSCCKYACHCCFLHEPCKGRDVLLAVEGSAVCLQYCGVEGVNSTDRDGLTVLHRLAQSGLAECLEVFIEAAGAEVDFLKRTKWGVNALQLARSSKSPECVDLLERATESAAKAAQDALLQELEKEGSKQPKNNSQGRKQKKKRNQHTVGDIHEKKQMEQETVKEKEEEEKWRREEAEKRERQLQIDAQYEAALEARRRQLEEQEKKMLQEAQEASLEEARKRQEIQELSKEEIAGAKSQHQPCLAHLQQLAISRPLVHQKAEQSKLGLQSQGEPDKAHLDPPKQQETHSVAVSRRAAEPGEGKTVSKSSGLVVDLQAECNSRTIGCGTAQNGSHLSPADQHAQMSSTLAAMAASMGAASGHPPSSPLQPPPPPSQSATINNSAQVQTSPVPETAAEETPRLPSGHHLPPSNSINNNPHEDVPIPNPALPQGEMCSDIHGQIWNSPIQQENGMADSSAAWQSPSMPVVPPQQNEWGHIPGVGGVDNHRLPDPWGMMPPNSGENHMCGMEGGPPQPPLMESATWPAYGPPSGIPGMEMEHPPAAYAAQYSANPEMHPQVPPGMERGGHLGSVQETSTGWPTGMVDGPMERLQNGEGMLGLPVSVAEGGGDDLVDDHQIMSWLSSEITGLIENGPDKAEEGGGMPTTPERRPRMVPTLSTPQRFRSFGNWQDAGFAGYERWPERPGSPITGSSNASNSPFYRMSPARAMGSASRGTQVWVPKTVMRPDPRFSSPGPMGGAGGSWDGMPTGPGANGFLETEDSRVPSKHLWLGNLNTKLPRAVLKSVFEEYGPVEDVVTFPGRMYAFVNFVSPEHACRAARELDNREVPALTSNRKLVIKFRPNRKALGRVGDLMPGVQCEDMGGLSSSRSAPSFQSWDGSADMGSPARGRMMDRMRMASMDYGPQEMSWRDMPPGALEEELRMYEEGRSEDDPSLPEGKPSRHLWLGNVCLRPSKTVLFSLFSRYGPVESVRIFPGKTFAFVNFQQAQHAARAKEALDGEVVSAISGQKSLVVRFQREGSGPPAWFRLKGPHVERGMFPQEHYGMLPQWRFSRYEEGLDVEDGMYDEDGTPAQNLSNRLNPNNIHFDGYLAARYKRMSKVEKEALWAEDRAAQQFLGELYPANSDATTALQDTTVREATSIGRLTRTLSAAALGKQGPGGFRADRNANWQSPSGMVGGSLGDLSEIGGYGPPQDYFGEGLSPYVDRTGGAPDYPVERHYRHHQTPSMPEFPTDFPDMPHMHNRLPSDVNMAKTMYPLGVDPHFPEVPGQAMAGGIGQFPNSGSLPADPFMTGEGSQVLGGFAVEKSSIPMSLDKATNNKSIW